MLEIRRRRIDFVRPVDLRHEPGTALRRQLHLEAVIVDANDGVDLIGQKSVAPGKILGGEFHLVAGQQPVSRGQRDHIAGDSDLLDVHWKNGRCGRSQGNRVVSGQRIGAAHGQTNAVYAHHFHVVDLAVFETSERLLTGWRVVNDGVAGAEAMLEA